MAVHRPKYESSYLHRFLNPKKLRKSIAYAVGALSGWMNEFDAIAFRGMSGALIAPAVAAAIGKPLIMVRKAGDLQDSHSSMSVEGDRAAKRYVILDDGVASGATKRAVIREIKTFNPKATCIGLLEVDRITARIAKQYRGRKFPLHTDN